MFNISSMYPATKGYHFDFDYYLNRHMPRSIALLSQADGFRGVSVERGLPINEQNMEQNMEPAYIALYHYSFDTIENFMAAFMPHTEELQGDIKNYTNIEPVLQINAVEIAQGEGR